MSSTQTWLRPLIVFLAISRLTRLLNDDYIMQPVRDAALKADPNSRHVGYWITCPACSSLWMAALAVILPAGLMRMLALSEAVVLLRQKETTF